MSKTEEELPKGKDDELYTIPHPTRSLIGIFISTFFLRVAFSFRLRALRCRVGRPGRYAVFARAGGDPCRLAARHLDHPDVNIAAAV